MVYWAAREIEASLLFAKCAENNTSAVGKPSKMELEDLEILTNMLLSNYDCHASLEI